MDAKREPVTGRDVDPFSLPPGPERRELMYAEGYNISLADFTDEEIAEIDRRIAEREALRHAPTP